MKRLLIAYFSVSGRTKKKSLMLANSTGADLYEIKPEIPYSSADVDWTDDNSRFINEMKNKPVRPGIIRDELKLEQYDTILLVFPIWGYIAPQIVNTFLESYDFTDKRIILFATSGGSGFGSTMDELKPSAPGADMVQGRLLNHTSQADIDAIASSL